MEKGSSETSLTWVLGAALLSVPLPRDAEILSLSLLSTLVNPSEPEPVGLDVGTSGAQVVSIVMFAACHWMLSESTLGQKFSFLVEAEVPSTEAESKIGRTVGGRGIEEEEVGKC